MLSTVNMQKCRPRRPSKGFTLAEILIALGILAIGMSMVAAIFPAALEFNRRSTNSTLGTIICENALVLSELRLTAEILDAAPLTGQLLIYADDAHYTDQTPPPAILPPFTRAQQHYPTDTADSRTGFVMMARQVPGMGVSYQFVTVAYRKTEASNKVVLKEINCTISGKNITVATDLRIGTPLINKATGQFAFVDSVNIAGTAGTLDIDTTKRTMPGGSSYVLLEASAAGNANPDPIPIATMRRSPAIGAMSKMTGLKHDPTPNP